MDQDEKSINELLDNLIKSSADPGEVHVCPICNGKIHVGSEVIRGGEMNYIKPIEL